MVTGLESFGVTMMIASGRSSTEDGVDLPGTEIRIGRAIGFCPCCDKPVKDRGVSENFSVDGQKVRIFECGRNDCRFNLIYGEKSLKDYKPPKVGEPAYKQVLVP